jgi:TatD DNase family protein
MIDLHCHLDLYPDPKAVAEKCVTLGMYVLSVTTTPSAWPGTNQLAPSGSHIRTGLGLHPQIAHERHGELSLFSELLPNSDYIGEIGLDGGPELRFSWDIQLRVFRSILELCAAQRRRPASIHSRRATKAVLDELEKQPGAVTPILHWFSGTPKELDRAIKLGCWFSVGPGMLASAKGRSLVEAMPAGRVITETDGPFARMPDGSPVMPWDVEVAEAGLANLWNMPGGAARVAVRDNFRNLLNEAK